MTGGDTDAPKSTISWEVFLNSDEEGSQDLVETESFLWDSHTENIWICRESLEFVVLFLFRCQPRFLTSYRFTPYVILTKTKLRLSVEAPMLTANKSKSLFSHEASKEGNGKFSPGEDISIALV